jgi:hypothetical protein
VRALLPLMLLSLAGCLSVDAQGASVAASGCSSGEVRQQVAHVFMGRNIGQTLGVSEEDFARFLDREVAPRFPDGYTVQDGQGRWLYEGVVYKEPSKVLMLILPGKVDDRKRLGEIAAAYEDQFRQDAVLTQVSSACVSFWLPKDRRVR